MLCVEEGCTSSLKKEWGGENDETEKDCCSAENDLRSHLNQKVFVDHKSSESQVWGKVILKTNEFLGCGYVQNSNHGVIIYLHNIMSTDVFVLV